jgi:hypothetical protein
MWFLVEDLTEFLALITADTVPFETPARLGISSIVILFIKNSGIY